MAGVVFDGDEDGGAINIKINKNCLYENFAYTLIKRRINKLKIIIFSFYVFVCLFFCLYLPPFLDNIKSAGEGGRGIVFDGDEDGGAIDIKINKNCLYENFAYTLIKRRINKLKIIIFSFYVFFLCFCLPFLLSVSPAIFG